MAFHNFFPEAIWISVIVALFIASAFVLLARRLRQRKFFSRAGRRAHHKTVASLPNTLRAGTTQLSTPHLSAPTPHARWETLTLRERQVAALAAAGKQNAEIADTLNVSPATISTHLKNIYRKLDIHSRRELANLLPDMQVLDDG